MAKTRKSPEVTLQYVLEGVEHGFTPFYGNVTNYRLEPNTGESVFIIAESYDTDEDYARWEKISFTLRLRDFIESLGVKGYEQPLIRKLKPWGPGG